MILQTQKVHLQMQLECICGRVLLLFTSCKALGKFWSYVWYSFSD